MQKRSSKLTGFTIIELLIVIVVIAILAAISVVAYNGVQERARASEVSSALSQAKKKIGVWQVDNPEATPASLATAGVSSSGSVSFQYKPGSNGAYCITATSGPTSYKITETSSPTKGGCSGHGVGGVAAVTNLAVDPRGTTLSAAIGWRNGRWFGSTATGSYSTITEASDGPVGITSYTRKTWSTTPSSMANSGDTGFENALASVFSVSAGDTYTISCYLRPSITRNFNIGIYQYISPGTAFSTPRVYGTNITGPANQWTRVGYTYTVPSGVGNISIACDSGSSTTGGATNWAIGSTLDGTGLMITEGSALHTYADGNSPGWDWNGTPNNSTSSGPPL